MHFALEHLRIPILGAQGWVCYSIPDFGGHSPAHAPLIVTVTVTVTPCHQNTSSMTSQLQP